VKRIRVLKQVKSLIGDLVSITTTFILPGLQQTGKGIAYPSQYPGYRHKHTGKRFTISVGDRDKGLTSLPFIRYREFLSTGVKGLGPVAIIKQKTAWISADLTAFQ
jgi:hypothetical protein